MAVLPETFDEAMKTDHDVIHEKQYEEATEIQCNKQIVPEQDTVKAIIRHHLDLGDDARVSIRWQETKIGSFNIGLPVTVEECGRPRLELFFRCAMPHKLGEPRWPGAVDEKMSCEVATYVWMQEKCPDIRIPHLYGFGLTDHRQFTHQWHRPFFTRAVQFFRRFFLSWVKPSTVLSRYVAHPSQHHFSFSAAYMLLEDVSSVGSRTLYETWKLYPDDQQRRRNLYRSLARTMISLARIPQPRIGAFRFHADGTITLSNRPLVSHMAVLENDGAPCFVPRDRTYTTADSYVSDMMSFHAGRLYTHRNAGTDAADFRTEMASQVAFRAVTHHFLHPDRRNGPFFLQFDDLHMANIFVDDDWNIRSLIDLEWISAQPLERMSVPHWLVDADLTEFKGERLDLFSKTREEFMKIFQDEELEASAMREPALSQAVEWTWQKGGSWFWTGIFSINALPVMYSDHIRPRYGLSSSGEEEEALSRLWDCDSKAIVQKKVEDYEAYRVDLKKMYSE